MTDALQLLEASALAGGLRGSVWAYPLVNVAHVLGIALLVGAIVPLDLRLMGLWPELPVEPLGRALRPVAAVGLILAVGAGGLLFLARATEYAESPWFLAKMGLVCAGGANALAASRVPPAALSRRRPLAVAAASASLACWLGALTLGRLVGYF